MLLSTGRGIFIYVPISSYMLAVDLSNSLSSCENLQVIHDADAVVKSANFLISKYTVVIQEWFARSEPLTYRRFFIFAPFAPTSYFLPNPEYAEIVALSQSIQEELSNPKVSHIFKKVTRKLGHSKGLVMWLQIGIFV